MASVDLGQKNGPTKFAKKFKIPLIVYGESPSEYGSLSQSIYEYVRNWILIKVQGYIYIRMFIR